jgi:hypothetical protein
LAGSACCDRCIGVFHFHCGIFATVSSFFTEVTLPDEFLALLSRRNNMQGGRMSVSTLFLILLMTFVVACALDRFFQSRSARQRPPQKGKGPGIPALKRPSDKKNDELEEQAKQRLLEQEANQIFAPVENHLQKLRQVLRATGASVEIDNIWEHLGDQRLRRVAKVICSASAQQLPLDLTIQGASVFYRNESYRFPGIKALLPVITCEVEQFLGAASGGDSAVPGLSNEMSPKLPYQR